MLLGLAAGLTSICRLPPFMSPPPPLSLHLPLPLPCSYSWLQGERAALRTLFDQTVLRLETMARQLRNAVASSASIDQASGTVPDQPLGNSQAAHIGPVVGSVICWGQGQSPDRAPRRGAGT